MRTDRKTSIYRLVLTGLMLGLATALSIVTVFKLPFGGEITACSMAPLIVIGQLYGVGWGISSCAVYGLLQLLLGLNNFTYATSIWAVLAIALLDYIGAYAVVGLSGATRKMKNKPLAASLGALIGGVLRFLFHFASGVVVWSEYANQTAIPSILHGTWFTDSDAFVYTYSFFYNGSYMLIETAGAMIISVVVVGVISRVNKK